MAGVPASMADIFESGPRAERARMEQERQRLWNMIPQTPWLTWMLLTKRPQNIRSMVPPAWLERWPENVWPCTTVGNQAMLQVRLPRMRWLLDLPQPPKVIMLSVEPMLGPIDFRPFAAMLDRGRERGTTFWTIFGGESGRPERPMRDEWLRHGIEQCRTLGLVPFIKQLGSWWAKEKGLRSWKREDLDAFPEDLRLQEFPPMWSPTTLATTMR